MSEPPSLHSRRPLTLRFDIPISKTKEFWESLKSGKFVTTKCTSCGAVSFPPQADCPRCMSGGHSWTDLGRDAVLVTYTQVSVAPASFSGSQPYVIAVGEFKVGVKVLAWLEGVRREDAKPGLRLRIEARNDPRGNPYYVFVPA